MQSLLTNVYDTSYTLMFYSWMKIGYKRGNYLLFFSSCSLHTTWISHLCYGLAWQGSCISLGMWHKKCSVAKTLWHCDTPSDIPGDKRRRPRGLPSHVPAIVAGPIGSNHQSPPGCPSLALTGACDSSAAAALLAALLHCPSGQSAPQLAPALAGVASVLAACQKEPEATEEVQISSNGLDPDGCAHDNSPPVPVVWVFVSEKHRGHHNHTAKLCMQDKSHWGVKEHRQLLW